MPCLGRVPAKRASCIPQRCLSTMHSPQPRGVPSSQVPQHRLDLTFSQLIVVPYKAHLRVAQSLASHSFEDQLFVALSVAGCQSTRLPNLFLTNFRAKLDPKANTSLVNSRTDTTRTGRDALLISRSFLTPRCTSNWPRQCVTNQNVERHECRGGTTTAREKSSG